MTNYVKIGGFSQHAHFPGCDDIIRQHKAACLRVTAVLACKDMLWVGTSAGVVVTMHLPFIGPGTSKITVGPHLIGENLS